MSESNHKWEALTCAKLGFHFTRCFEGQVHQVPYLGTGEVRKRWGIFLAMARVLYHSGIGTLYAKGTLMEKDKLPRNHEKTARTNRLQLWLGDESMASTRSGARCHTPQCWA